MSSLSWSASSLPAVETSLGFSVYTRSRPRRIQHRPAARLCADRRRLTPPTAECILPRSAATARDGRSDMSHEHDDGTQHAHHDHHECASFFGCGDEKGTGVLREDIKDAAVTKRSADRLLNMDEVDQQALDGYLAARGRSRRELLRASSFMGLLAAVGPWFGKVAQAQGAMGATGSQRSDSGRVVTVESNKDTVRLGVFDANLAPVVTIDSGDTVSYPNTWSHFLNAMQPGTPVEQLAKLRVDNPG